MLHFLFYFTTVVAFVFTLFALSLKRAIISAGVDGIKCAHAVLGDERRGIKLSYITDTRPNEKIINNMSTFFSAFSDSTRLKIIMLK